MPLEFGFEVREDNMTHLFARKYNKMPLFKEDSKFVNSFLENIIDKRKKKQKKEKVNDKYSYKKCLGDEKNNPVKLKLSSENDNSIFTASSIQ